MPVKLNELLARIPGEFWSRRPSVPDDLVVRGLCCDSRRTKPGDLFCALPGRRTDGARFIGEAHRRGAAAVLVEGDQASVGESAGPIIRARSARAAMGLIAALFHGEPSRELRVVGVTGTDGKTSTTWLLRHILSVVGRRAVAAGTMGLKGDGPSSEPWAGVSKAGAPPGEEACRAWQPTTPEAPAFQESLARLKAAGVQDVVAEISSHALVQDRIFGTQFSAVALTHVSADHLDFHGSREAYREAKARLFNPASRGGPLETAAVQEVLNLDDPLGRCLAESRGGRCVTFGRAEGADVRLLGNRNQPDGMVLEIAFAGRREQVKTPLAGGFHAQNLLAASAIAHALGLGSGEIVPGLATAPAIPGRFEAICEGQPFTVIVDYAHTAEGLRRLLEAVREMGTGRLILAFGCGGDRDASKRAAMGRIAARLADHVLLTTDNPRSEDPGRIAEQVAAGLREGSGSWEALPDRRRALARAIQAAGEGDTVVSAGKGSESIQIFRDHVEPFDDRRVLRDLLREYNPSMSAARTMAPDLRRGRQPRRGPGGRFTEAS